MKRISASTTFSKKVLPVIMFGMLAPLVPAAILSRDPLFLVLPCVIGLAWYLMLKNFAWNLADEVYDAGDFLVVWKRGQEHHLPLTDVVNVRLSRGPQMTLKLAGASARGPLGHRVDFLVPQSLLHPFASSKAAEDLRERLDRARSQPAP